MAATSDQFTLSRSGAEYGYPVKGATRIFARTLVALTSAGLAVPAGTAGAVKIAGLSLHHADNRDGADAGGIVRTERGTYALSFDVAPTAANLRAAVYAVDDVTVSLDSSSGARLQVGTLDGIEAGTPWTRVSS
ncbi:hypothetical protein [Segnochrobactrum spirostomi]|uniref:Uncharacterized protein n=1 Tax=Segnochrobactrum spirostomi TaxID=2608987 RepID=A0A6A7Y5D3_9HYPH|nr:hypothetical protein [Segnochrobactrum spirostomi]MQT14394.1 hypothetical protein [Segnochrobactrum spirostomi]